MELWRSMLSGIQPYVPTRLPTRLVALSPGRPPARPPGSFVGDRIGNRLPPVYDRSNGLALNLNCFHLNYKTLPRGVLQPSAHWLARSPRRSHADGLPACPPARTLVGSWPARLHCPSAGRISNTFDRPAWWVIYMRRHLTFKVNTIQRDFRFKCFHSNIGL